MFCNSIHTRQPHVLGTILVQEPVLISYNQLYSSNRQQKRSTCVPWYDPISYLFPMTEVTDESVGLSGPSLVPSLPSTITSIPIPAHVPSHQAGQEVNEQPH